MSQLYWHRGSSAVLVAIADEGWSLSRGGFHEKAVEIFRKGIEVAQLSYVKPHLLVGLATAHMVESERAPEKAKELKKAAAELYQEAIEMESIQPAERISAYLSLAKALGELGHQDEALGALDRATAELAHQGSPQAQELIEKRSLFEAGEWAYIKAM